MHIAFRSAYLYLRYLGLCHVRLRFHILFFFLLLVLEFAVVSDFCNWRHSVGRYLNEIKSCLRSPSPSSSRLMAKTVADVMKMVKENEVKFVDFRFTDTRGKEQHVTVPVSHFDEDKFTSGHAFDGSSVAGWKGIEASDM